MLKLISLWTFKKIFERSKIELSSTAKMLYINCMVHHFEELDEQETNSHAFKIYDGEMDFKKYIKTFAELEKAGLVKIESNGVIFENHWGQFIDRSALTKINAPINTISHFETELYNNNRLFEHCSKTFILNREKLDGYIVKFIDEQQALNKIYHDFNDVSRHFYFWLQKQLPTNPQPSKGSSSTILGM